MTRLLTSLFFILSASSVQALCEGNACEFIQIKEVDDCIVLVNTHVQNEVRVSVAAEEMGYTWKIPANTETNATVEGDFCLNNWYRHGHEARFVATENE